MKTASNNTENAILKLKEGIEEKKIEGVSVRIYNPAKTVADCFKYRNKVGIDVAIESLKECWRSQRCTVEELVHYARICRVRNIISQIESLDRFKINPEYVSPNGPAPGKSVFDRPACMH